MYGGDPLLDFSLANFFDRISYKAPKSKSKLARLKKRMAQVEEPVNIEGGSRTEEEFFRKYFEMKKSQQKENGKEEDIEAFADQEIEKEMERMMKAETGGFASEDDDVDMDMDEDEDGQDEDQEDGSEN